MPFRHDSCHRDLARQKSAPVARVVEHNQVDTEFLHGLQITSISDRQTRLSPSRISVLRVLRRADHK
jgi:hypothetical protein